jgi:hypothetical protein
MRIEGCSTVVFASNRRQRFEERRSVSSDRRRPVTSERRARHQAHLWFAPAFGAHILGQVSPETVTAEHAERAYLQPEAKTPLRPSLIAMKA